MLGEPQSRSGRRREEKILVPTGTRTPTSSVVQPVASRCTDYAGETEVLGENLHQRYFVHHKSHLTKPGLEPGSPRWEASD
jgi:hypothetical protein